MRRRPFGAMLATLAALALAAALPGPASAGAAARDLLVADVTVIDPVQGRRPGMDVLIRGGRIEAVRPHGAQGVGGARLVDGRGRFLIPGLWDMHVHLSFDAEVSASMLSLFIAHGITAVRDTGGPLDAVLAWRRRAERATPQAPRVFVAGPLLDGVPTVYDGSAEGYPALSVAVTDPRRATAWVDALAARGVDFIKAYEMLDPATFRQVVARARRHGLPVAGHVPLTMSPAQASDAGLASIEHLRNVEIGCTASEGAMLDARRAMLAERGDAPGREVRRQAHAAHRLSAALSVDWARCERLLERMNRNGTRQVPTLALVRAVYEGFHAEPGWRASFDLLPPAARETWRASSERLGGLFAEDPAGNAGRAAYLAWVRSVVARLAGTHMIMAGTDTPIFFMTPGLSLHEELASLVGAGLTPAQALEAATLTPARFFGLEAEAGAVAPGFRADLVLLEADPLEDIRHTVRIGAVVRDGALLDRAALDAVLAAARQ